MDDCSDCPTGLALGTSDQLKVLVFSKLPISPAHGGNRQRIRTLLAELKNEYQITFALIPSRQTRDIDIQGHELFFGEGRFFQIKRRKLAEYRFNANALFYRIRTRFFGDTLSDNVDYLFDTSIETTCRHLIDKFKPDVVMVVYVHFSKILEWAPRTAFKILDAQDSFAKEFTPNAERNGFLRADSVLAIQDHEAYKFKDLIKDNIGTNVVTVSHIIADMELIDYQICGGASFIGSYFLANNDSLAALITNVMPIVLANRPNFKLHVIGDVGRAIPDYPFVVKHGRVEVIADALANAPVLANYIIKGTGIKIKMLDAMMMGVPCVSTLIGAEGISEKFLGGACIANDDNQFAHYLIKLFDDAPSRAALSKAAMEAADCWNQKQRTVLHELFGRML